MALIVDDILGVMSDTPENMEIKMFIYHGRKMIQIYDKKQDITCMFSVNLFKQINKWIIK
jgi:hypothetical protein